MSFQSIVYGRIVSGNSIKENENVIQKLEKEQAFPWILTEMFNINYLNNPYYFDSPIITFGASYKQVEDDLTTWIIKFESILDNLDFVSAKIQIETEIYGTYDFYWKSKKYNYGNHDDQHYLNLGLSVAENWYFGYGKRNLWGISETNDTDNYISTLHNIIHPFILTNDDRILVEKLYQLVGFNNLIYFYDLPKDFLDKQERLYQILTLLQTKNKIEFKVRNTEEKHGPYLIIKNL